MTGTDSSQPANLAPEQPLPITSQPAVGVPPTSSDTPGSAADAQAAEAAAQARRRILIGSQRDPAAYRARRQRDWTPVEGEAGESAGQAEGEGRNKRRRHRGGKRHGRPGDAPAAPQSPVGEGVASMPPAAASAPQPETPIVVPVQAPEKVAVKPQAATVAETAVAPAPVKKPQVSADTMAELAAELSEGVAAELKAAVEAAPSGRVAPPSRRDRLSADLEDEFDKALGGMSLDELMTAGIPQGTETLLEPETKVQGRVVAVRRDDVFLELAGREQGIVPLQQFPQPPEIGAVVEVVVQRFNPEEGLYDLRFPEVAADVGDWGDVHEGMLVDVTVTAHNTGGLECEVNHIRGFIPVSQIALYRVEDLAQFVGQRFACIIVEANPERRNLVLSRRAVLEREKEEARENLFASLQVGQVHQGTVRKIMDFGAFVDIGGVDGLLHVSQLSWGRVGHPKDVLSEGQPIQVRIERIDKETGKLSFSYRELLENPWATAAQKFLPNSIVKGKVVKLMDFGAFVELEPGVEGLIHISELAPKRVFRVSDVVKEGEEVEVLVLSVNTESQRMSLSIKALAKPAEPTEKEKREAEAGELPAAKAKRKQQAPTGPLTGGLGRPAGGDRFGLKW